MKEILGNIALWPAEQLINAAIRGDSHVQGKLNAFTGKAIQINTRSPSLQLRIVFAENELRLTAIDSAQFVLPVDAAISGTASGLFAQLTQHSSQQPLVGGSIAITGDVQLVQDLFAAIKSLDVDWQDYLSPILGDVLTYQLDQSVTETRAWATDSNRRMRASVDDYLKEEAKIFPHEQQIRNFSDDLDALRLGIDRIQARIERLRHNLTTLEAHSTNTPAA